MTHCRFGARPLDIGVKGDLAQRDVTLLAVSRAPLDQIEAFKKRMDWRFTWVSSHGTDFNFDYHVSFTKGAIETGEVDYNFERREFPSEEAPGISVFYKDEHDDIFHTYSAYARGLDLLVGAYNYLDLAPKGRDEDALASTATSNCPRTSRTAMIFVMASSVGSCPWGRRSSAQGSDPDSKRQDAS